MATELPEPKSRKESYLAKAAGVDTTIPEEPESREEQYLAAIAEGGGGGGGTADFDKLTNRPKYNGAEMTSETNIPLAPSIVQTTGSSTTDVMSQDAATKMIFRRSQSSSATDFPNTSICIGRNTTCVPTYGIVIGDNAYIGASSDTDGIAIGKNALLQSSDRSRYAISIGSDTKAKGEGTVCIGYRAGYSSNNTQNHNVFIGYSAGNQSLLGVNYSVGIGAYATPTRAGEVNVGAGSSTTGYNSTVYRVIGGVHDPVYAHDAATKNYVDSRSIEATNLYVDYNYVPQSSGVSFSDVTFYKDASLTTPYIISEIIDAASTGTVYLVQVNTEDPTAITRFAFTSFSLNTDPNLYGFTGDIMAPSNAFLITVTYSGTDDYFGLSS